MEFKDYYNLMGLDRDASQDEIKRAYRKLARKFHPDVSKDPDAETRFKEVGEAYEVLKDPEKRAAYDELGADWKSGQDFHPPPDWDAGFEFRGADFQRGSASSPHSDFFESLFGSGFGPSPGPARSGAPMRGEDHHAKVLIELNDAWQGSSRTISLRIPELDDPGRLRMLERKLNVRIPKGIKQGQHIRLAGQGAPGAGGGPAGDLYVEPDAGAVGVGSVGRI